MSGEVTVGAALCDLDMPEHVGRGVNPRPREAEYGEATCHSKGIPTSAHTLLRTASLSILSLSDHIGKSAMIDDGKVWKRFPTKKGALMDLNAA